MASSISIDADATLYARADDKKMLDNDDTFPSGVVKGTWERELSDWNGHCTPNGWMVCCCPCVSIAQISVRIGVDSYGAALAKQLAYKLFFWALVALMLVCCDRMLVSVASDLREGTSISSTVVLGVCCLVIVLSFFWMQSLVTLHTRVRERFGIDGSPSGDTCTIMFCTTCAIAQMATQVKSYTPKSCGFRAPDM